LADPLRGQRVAANWEAVVKTKPEDQIHDDYWLFNRLSKGNAFVGLSGGDFISSPIEYGLNTTAGSYSDLDTFSTTRVDVFDRYEYQWKENIVVVVMSELEEDRNAGAGEVFPLLPAKLENARQSMRREMNRQMHANSTGNGGKDMDGVQALISITPATGSPGGINAANFSFWRNQQTAGTQTASAFDNLRAAMRSIYNLCSNGVGDQHPTFAETTRTVFEGFEGLLLANERFTSKESADGGFKNEVVKFKGCLLSYDNAAASGELRFYNEQFIKLVYKTGKWMKARPEVNPANQTAGVIAIRTNADLIATNRRRLGVVSAIT